MVYTLSIEPCRRRIRASRWLTVRAHQSLTPWSYVQDLQQERLKLNYQDVPSYAGGLKHRSDSETVAMNQQEPTQAQFHARKAVDVVLCGVLTISDSRTASNDVSGDCVSELLKSQGHEIVVRELLPDDRHQVADWITHQCASGNLDTVLTTRGTGLTSRDQTVEAVEHLFERRIPGFGELFRMLSFDDIGPAAMLSRATAGTIGRTLVFCMPGSPDAVELAVRRLIAPTLPHIGWLLRR